MVRKRALLVQETYSWQKRPTTGKRGLLQQQKRPTKAARETYDWQKRPTTLPAVGSRSLLPFAFCLLLRRRSNAQARLLHRHTPRGALGTWCNLCCTPVVYSLHKTHGIVLSIVKVSQSVPRRGPGRARTRRCSRCRCRCRCSVQGGSSL